MAKKETQASGDPFMDAVLKINTEMGSGAVMGGNEIIETERLSTGSLSLDIITGGGYGYGRIIEAAGPESSGKTTIGIHGAIAAQKAHPDKKVVIIDFEHALDRVYCENLGLDMDKVFLSQPSNGEEGLEIADRLISTGKVSYCLIDSVAAIVPKAEVEGEMGDNQIGLQARLMSKAMRKLTGTINKYKTVVYITNQIRMKIGVMFGSPETTSGGQALKFFASIRLDVRGRQNVNSKDANGEATANTVKVKTVKNKLAPPFKVCEFDIEYGKGIDRASEVFTYAETIGLIKRSGSWFSYGETKLGQGAESVKTLLRDNIELMDELETLIKEAYDIR